jgi:hypothetical protein
MLARSSQASAELGRCRHGGVGVLACRTDVTQIAVGGGAIGQHLAAGRPAGQRAVQVLLGGLVILGGGMDAGPLDQQRRVPRIEPDRRRHVGLGLARIAGLQPGLARLGQHLGAQARRLAHHLLAERLELVAGQRILLQPHQRHAGAMLGRQPAAMLLPDRRHLEPVGRLGPSGVHAALVARRIVLEIGIGPGRRRCQDDGGAQQQVRHRGRRFEACPTRA